MAVSLGGARRRGLGHKHRGTQRHLEALAGAPPESRGAPAGGAPGLPEVTLMGSGLRRPVFVPTRVTAPLRRDPPCPLLGDILAPLALPGARRLQGRRRAGDPSASHHALRGTDGHGIRLRVSHEDTKTAEVTCSAARAITDPEASGPLPVAATCSGLGSVPWLSPSVTRTGCEEALPFPDATSVLNATLRRQPACGQRHPPSPGPAPRGGPTQEAGALAGVSACGPLPTRGCDGRVGTGSGAAASGVPWVGQAREAPGRNRTVRGPTWWRPGGEGKGHAGAVSSATCQTLTEAAAEASPGHSPGHRAGLGPKPSFTPTGESQGGECMVPKSNRGQSWKTAWKSPGISATSANPGSEL